MSNIFFLISVFISFISVSRMGKLCKGSNLIVPCMKNNL
jgi:hypothetical protein